MKAVARGEDADKPAPNPPQEEAELTPRQLEILRLVALGLSNKELSERLYLSEHTIKYHMGEIFRRLHLKKRDQAADYAARKD